MASERRGAGKYEKGADVIKAARQQIFGKSPSDDEAPEDDLFGEFDSNIDRHDLTQAPRPTRSQPTLLCMILSDTDLRPQTPQGLGSPAQQDWESRATQQQEVLKELELSAEHRSESFALPSIGGGRGASPGDDDKARRRAERRAKRDAEKKSKRSNSTMM